MIEKQAQKEIVLYCIVFCSALFLAITISPPAFQYNDEWIPANQLHQLATGHQVTTSEGKYGSFIGNENTEYFITRGNILGYSLFLPILSLPAYQIFITLNQGFRLLILFIWAILPIIIALLTLIYFPDHSRILHISWPWFLIIGAIVGFFWNLKLFTPFSAIGQYDPIEAAALIFTDHILFAVLAVILFFTCKILFKDSHYSLFGTCAIICSSSYIYWASSAKDHMLVAVVFAFIISSIFFMLLKGDFRYGIFPFFSCGILAWIRPELAFVFAFGIILIYFYLLYQKRCTFISNKQLICAIFIPLFILIGSIPFFINNSVITGDPLTPAYIFMEESSVTTQGIDTNIPEEIPIEDANNTPQQKSGLIQLIFKYFSPQWNTIIQDTYKILFAPSSGMIGIFAVCPLLLIGLGLLVYRTIGSEIIIKKCYSEQIIVCIIAILVVFIAYISGLHGMIISQGIGPDMRYLSPLYIPAGLLGIITLRELPQFQIQNNKLFRSLVGILIILTPVIFLGFLFYPPFGGGFPGYTRFVTISVLLLSVFFIVFQLFQLRYNIPVWINHGFLAAILALPFTWNLLLVIMFSITRSNGYSFWLPVLEGLYNYFIIPVG